MREDTTEVVIDDADELKRVRKFTLALLPRFANRIRKYELRRPLFDHYKIEPALRLAVARRVPLRSGGSHVIDVGAWEAAAPLLTDSIAK
jgi:Ribonuclease G/E